MSNIDWNEIAENTRNRTNEEFQKEITSLLRFTHKDIERIMERANIDKERFSEVIKVVKNSSLTNNKKAKAIGQIDNGLRMLVGIVERLV